MLSDVHHQIANLLHELPPTAAPEVGRLGLVGTLQQSVELELGSNFDAVEWHIDPTAEQAARAIPTLAAEVVFYAAREVIRNAARYGRTNEPTRSLHLTIGVRWQAGLLLTIEDDGVGLGATGAGSRESGGSGQGLALHSTMMAVIGGTLMIESTPGTFTRVTLALPDLSSTSWHL
jgi:signal transduction histidine kinase